ncbi:MAG: hypothetical protein GY847_16560 [Proteobacteria bacterium]|nr:hypothetical protein [Pseudomonadota bacterium]
MLTPNQRRLLVGLSQEPQSTSVFTADFIQRYGMRSASNVQRSIEALLKRDLIDRNDVSYNVTDRFLKLWLSRRYR